MHFSLYWLKRGPVLKDLTFHRFILGLWLCNVQRIMHITWLQTIIKILKEDMLSEMLIKFCFKDKKIQRLHSQQELEIMLSN